jgi:uncharacterized membrane protein HdeD (DUF308 family)
VNVVNVCYNPHMNLKRKWLALFAIVLGIVLGLVAFNIPRLDISHSILPLFIYFIISIIFYFINKNPFPRNKLFDSFLFLGVSIISHLIPAIIFVLSVLISGMH